MDEQVSDQLVKDTEEMVSWRRISQEEIDEIWKRIAAKSVSCSESEACRKVKQRRKR